jgi:hypothetical protein
MVKWNCRTTPWTEPQETRRKRSARWKPDHSPLVPERLAWKKFASSLFPNSRPLPSKYCVAIAFRTAATTDVVRIPLSRWVLSLLDTIAALAAGSPPAASFFAFRFCVPVSASNRAWIHSRVMTCWGATGRHRAPAKDFRFALLQLLVAQVQALHRHGIRSVRRTLHRHVKTGTLRTAAASRSAPPVRICIGVRANTSNDGQAAAFKCNFATLAG